MGSGSDAHAELAAPLGSWLAARGVHLLTGGGGGTMAAVARAFVSVPDRKGLAIGVIPGDETGRRGAPAGYPNESIELPVYTHLPYSGTRGTDPLSRNHINVLSSDVIVALPGSHGTAAEVRLAVRYGRPIIACVRASGDIPDLPPDVPTATDLATIQEFVNRNLPGS